MKIQLASDLHLDAIVPGAELRRELVLRFSAARTKRSFNWPRKRAVLPV